MRFKATVGDVKPSGTQEVNPKHKSIRRSYSATTKVSISFSMVIDSEAARLSSPL